MLGNEGPCSLAKALVCQRGFVRSDGIVPGLVALGVRGQVMLPACRWTTTSRRVEGLTPR